MGEYCPPVLEVTPETLPNHGAAALAPQAGARGRGRRRDARHARREASEAGGVRGARRAARRRASSPNPKPNPNGSSVRESVRPARQRGRRTVVPCRAEARAGPCHCREDGRCRRHKCVLTAPFFPILPHSCGKLCLPTTPSHGLPRGRARDLVVGAVIKLWFEWAWPHIGCGGFWPCQSWPLQLQTRSLST